MRDEPAGNDSEGSARIGALPPLVVRDPGLSATQQGLSVPLPSDETSQDFEQATGLARSASNEDGADHESRLILARVTELQAEHSALDTLIDKLTALPGVNDFELRRLKKRKLKVKDTIMLLQLQLEPDARA
jgi:hypothetical protein